MQLTTYLTTYTGLSAAELFGSAPPLVVITKDHESDALSVTTWNVPGAAKPSSADLATALAAPEPVSPAVVPASVTAAQARIALSRAGKLDAVTTAVNAAGGEVLIWFEYATAWERQNQHVLDLGQGIGLTPAQIDGLFTEAATIAA